MTDSILRSYQYYSTTSIVPFPPQAALPPFASDLLVGETDGFSIDATTYDEATDAAYVGGPVGGTLAVINTGDPTDDLDDVPLDASNLAQAGTSAKLVHFPDSPYVRWAPHNYILQSQTLDNAAWTTSAATITANATTAPDGTSTADRINVTGSGYIHTTSTITILAETIYTGSVYAKVGTGSNWLLVSVFDASVVDQNTRYWFNISTGATGTVQSVGGAMINTASTMTDAGNGWWRCTFTFSMPATYTTADIYFGPVNGNLDNTADSGDTQFWWGAQFNRGSIATPYLVTTSAARIGIAQSYDTVAEQYGVLNEAAGTNEATYSNLNPAQWVAVNSSASLNATSPENVANGAYTYTGTAGADAHGTRKNIGGLTLTNTNTFSCYFKQGTARYVGIACGDTANHYFGATWDLSDGTLEETKVGSSSGTVVSTSITSIGDGWYRCTLTGSATTGTVYQSIFMAGANPGTWVSSGGIPFVNNAGSETMLAWGAQAELGSVATSFIPTLGGTQTRAKDNISTALSTVPYSATKGTFYIDLKPRLHVTTTSVIGMQGVNNSEQLAIYWDTGSSIYFYVEDGAVPQANLDCLVNVAANTRSQMTGAWASNDIDISADGAAVASDPSATLPTLTDFVLGQNGDRSTTLTGFIYRMVYVPRQVETEDANLEVWRYEA